MYNNQGQITVGHQRKKRVKKMLYNFFRDNHIQPTWDREDVQSVIGELSYVQSNVHDHIIVSFFQ